MARTRQRRRVFLFVVAVGIALGAQILACETAPTRDAPICTPGAVCTCAEDPTQPLCKGFNDRPEGGFDVGPIFDSGDTGVRDSADAATDGPDDSGDAADAADD